MSTMKLNKFELIMWKTSNLIVPGASNVKSKYKRPWAGKSQLAVIPQQQLLSKLTFPGLWDPSKGMKEIIFHVFCFCKLRGRLQESQRSQVLKDKAGRDFRTPLLIFPRRTSLSGQDEEPGFIFPRKPGKREPFWRNCLHQTGLEASLWGILLDQWLVCKGSAHCVWWRKWGANAQDGGPGLYKNSS